MGHLRYAVTKSGFLSTVTSEFDHIRTMGGNISCSRNVQEAEIVPDSCQPLTASQKNDGCAELDDLLEYEYPFENLVFEGGGNKGVAYCGSLMVLNNLGVLDKVKRLSGASAGAMLAALISVGFSEDEILDFLAQDVGRIFLDHKWGYFSLLPNLVNLYGWNPGHKVYDWFGEVLGKKTGNPDITFMEVYKRYGKELCIVVTNVNHMAVEYCHPKTTPHMPVRLSLRMSISIPGVFAPPRYGIGKGEEKCYVDGGLLCNYPIHSFDGWWLSMDRNDTFLTRLRPLDKMLKFYDKSARFGTYNSKTLGFLLFSENEPEIMRTHLEERLKDFNTNEYPVTNLSKKKNEKGEKRFKESEKHEEIAEAFDKLMKVIDEHNPEHQQAVDLTLFSAALQDSDLTKNDQILLFEKEIQNKDDIKKAFETLDINKNNQIEYQELVTFLGFKGVDVQSRFLGYSGQDITDLQSFLTALFDTMITNTKRAFVEERDKDRTVGINTGYIDTTDFTLEEEDRKFLIRQGWNGTVAFFKEYVQKNRTSLKRSNTSSSYSS